MIEKPPFWDVESFRHRSDGNYWAWIGTVRAIHKDTALALALDKYPPGDGEKLRVKKIQP